jgi:excinuclease ABC subunit C
MEHTAKFINIPDQPGVYIMKNGAGQILYIGKAKVLSERVKNYFQKSGDNREMIPYLIKQVENIETIVTFTEKEALLLEHSLIKKYKPKYNILLKDDKAYLSIMINQKETWPKIELVRYKGKEDSSNLYFGPYTSALAARQTYEILTKTFPLRQCSDKELRSRKRPCLLYSIKRCIAPCVNKCTPAEYKEVVDQTVLFLKGKNTQVMKALTLQMEKASLAMQYEKAAALLRTIRQIEEIASNKELPIYSKTADCDAISFIRKGNYILLVILLFREGKLISSEHYDFSQVLPDHEEFLSSFLMQYYKEKPVPDEVLLPLPLADQPSLEEVLQTKILSPQTGEKKGLIDLAHQNVKALFEQEQRSTASNEDLLLQLQELLSLSRLPSRIECFDTSNTSLSQPVASMVVFIDGIKSPKDYRLYKIKEKTKADDYSALTEVLYRRLKRAKEEELLPDLLIIDGGKGQLNIALDVLQNLDIVSIDVISLVKENARHDKGLTSEKIYTKEHKDPLSIDKHSPLLFLLQRIRDEAHRKAITYHRKERKKESITSLLDSIPGIGPAKKTALLKHFGSLKRIKEASNEEILSLPLITEKDLKSLREYLT